MTEEIVVDEASRQRCCLWCVHFYAGYRTIECNKGHWDVDIHEMFTKQFRGYMLQALDCGDFVSSRDLSAKKE